MSSDVIVSHVASSEYRERIDAMMCKHPGCKRWRVDGTTKYCPGHQQADPSTWRDRKFHAGVACYPQPGKFVTAFGGKERT